MTAVFMSHALCWKRIAEGEHDFGLILEDDVEVLDAIVELKEVLVAGSTPEIMFVNSKMHRHLRLAGLEGNGRTWTPASEIVQGLARNLPLEKFEAKNFDKQGILTAPGGDAYVLTKSAAKKLLEAAKPRIRLPHVDVFIHFVAAGQSVFSSLGKIPRVFQPYQMAKNLELPSGVFHRSCVKSVEELARTSTRLPGGTSDYSPQEVTETTRKEHSRAIVHIGFHNTGTTYVQKLILNPVNRNLFSKTHHLVVQHMPEARHLRPIFFKLHRSVGSPEEEKAYADLVSEIGLVKKTALNSGKSILISDEEFAGMMLGRIPGKVAYPAIGQVVRAICEGLSPMPVRFVFYTRDLQRWYRSAWSYNIAFHEKTFTFEEYMERFAGRDQLNDALQRATEMANRFGAEVKHVRFEDDVRSDFGLGLGVIEELDLPGEDMAKIRRIPPVNESFPAPILEMFRRLNMIEMHRPLRRKIYDAIAESEELFATPSSDGSGDQK